MDKVILKEETVGQKGWVVYGDNYERTKTTDDCVRCINSERWLHENCLKYENNFSWS